MKSILVKLEVVFFIFGFIIFCNLEAGGADWRHYGTTEGMQKFIEGKLSGKKSVSTEEIEEMYKEWQKEFLRDLVISEKRMLIELKCGENMFRLISGIEVDEKGNLKKAFSASQTEWLPIHPETPIEGLYNMVCPKAK